MKRITIPSHLSHLDVDHRGYPVPVNVARDHDGRPRFAVNDTRVREQLFAEDLCSICGRKLLRGRWSIGGPGGVLHENGVLLDPPVHRECAEFALEVCPYLAAPSYGRSVVGLEANSVRLEKGQLLHNPTVHDNRPPIFVAAMHVGQTLCRHPDGTVRSMRPKRPYRSVEFWRQGVRLPDDEGIRIAQDYIAEQLPLWRS